MKTDTPEAGKDYYECREEDDRWHHAWHTADSLCVDIYKNGEVVVLVKIGDNTEILQCGTIATSHNDRNA